MKSFKSLMVLFLCAMSANIYAQEQPEKKSRELNVAGKGGTFLILLNGEKDPIECKDKNIDHDALEKAGDSLTGIGACMTLEDGSVLFNLMIGKIHEPVIQKAYTVLNNVVTPYTGTIISVSTKDAFAKETYENGFIAKSESTNYVSDLLRRDEDISTYDAKGVPIRKINMTFENKKACGRLVMTEYRKTEYTDGKENPIIGVTKVTYDKNCKSTVDNTVEASSETHGKISGKYWDIKQNKWASKTVENKD